MVIEMTYDDSLHFNLKKLPKRTDIPAHPDFDKVLDMLFFFSKSIGCTNSQKQNLANMCLDNDWSELVTLICNKDLKCSIGAMLINKAVPNTIKIFPYMRCISSKGLNNLVYPAYSQSKEDGLFVNIFTRNKDILSRNGGEYIFPRETPLMKSIYTTFDEPKTSDVLMGELRVRREDGKGYLPRKTGNPIINKALKKNIRVGIPMDEAVRIHLIVWDIVPEKDYWNCECLIPYKKRLERVFHLFSEKVVPNCHLVKTVTVYSAEEAQARAVEEINNGDEGTVVKNFSGIWVHSDTGSKDQVKLKAGDLGKSNERVVELRVVGFEYGEAGRKYENGIGSLICETEDGILQTNVGIGLKDKDRMSDYSTTFHNQIVQIRFNEIIQDKKNSKPRMFLARFEEIRHDKNKANTFLEVEEECRAKKIKN